MGNSLWTEEDKKRLGEIEERLNATTVGPWFWNTYSQVQSGPLCQTWDDDDTPGYPPKPRPGPPWFTEEDNAWLAQREAAYAVDPSIAFVPAEYGDTATKNHAADADFIAEAKQDVPWLIEKIKALLADSSD